MNATLMFKVKIPQYFHLLHDGSEKLWRMFQVFQQMCHRVIVQL